MSQIAKLFDGTVKKDIETITGDVGGAVGADAAFNINLLSDNFLTVTGVPGTNTLTISMDGAVLGTGQTIGAVTADLVTINLGATPTTYIIEAKVAGFEATTPTGAGYNLICLARTTGAAATIIGTQDKYVAEEAAAIGCDGNFIAVGNTIVVRVTGVAGLTINWKVATIQMGV